MAISCLKYSLAFLLGAMTFGLIIVLQLQRDAIRLEIHWKNGGGLSSKASSSSPAVDHNHSSIRVVKSADLAIPDASNFDSSVKHTSIKDFNVHFSEVIKLNQQQKPENMLSRHARQLPQELLRDAPLLSNRPNIINSRQSKRMNARTKSIKSEEIVTSIEEALSRTAPDWVGSVIPPAQLPDVEQCSDEYCLEYLSEVERRQFDECKQRTLNDKDRIGSMQSNDTCHFQNGTNRHPVALASFPGSGNTWMRGLLQKITGICTGALYCDKVLRARGFTGEFVRGSSVIAIKTHGVKGLFTHSELPRRIFNYAPIFGAAILLVRDPKSALVAEWHRERSKRQTNSTSSSHYLAVGEQYFKNNKDWDKYIREKTKRWSAEVSGWVIAGKDNPFLVVCFEDLKKDTVKEMKRVMNFLGFTHISESDIKERLGEGYNSFYRNHKDNFSHFTEEQKSFIHQQVESTINTLREHGRENIFPIDKYL